MANHVVLMPGQGIGIVCTGGAVNGATPTNSTNFWNFCTGSWQTLPANSQARSNLRGCGANDSIVYAIGGFTTVGVGTSEKLTFSQIDGSCSSITGTATYKNGVPNGFALTQNFPNPFNPVTTISYSLPYSSNVNLVVTDALGRELAVLVNEFKPAGFYEIEYDASSFASGIYFYSIKAGDFKDTKKMLLVK
jgi:hypothetical protein